MLIPGIVIFVNLRHSFTNFLWHFLCGAVVDLNSESTPDPQRISLRIPPIKSTYGEPQVTFSGY